NSLTDIALMEGLLKRPSASAKHFQEAVDMVERMGGNYEQSADARISFQGKHQITYSGCVDSQLTIADVPGAFATVQKMKGRALLGLMANRDEARDPLSAAEQGQLDKEKAKTSRLNLNMVAEGVINAPGSKKRYTKLKSELRSAEDRYQALSIALSA